MAHITRDYVQLIADSTLISCSLVLLQSLNELGASRPHTQHQILVHTPKYRLVYSLIDAWPLTSCPEAPLTLVAQL